MRGPAAGQGRIPTGDPRARCPRGPEATRRGPVRGSPSVAGCRPRDRCRPPARARRGRAAGAGAAPFPRGGGRGADHHRCLGRERDLPHHRGHRAALPPARAHPRAVGGRRAVRPRWRPGLRRARSDVPQGRRAVPVPQGGLRPAVGIPLRVDLLPGHHDRRRRGDRGGVRRVPRRVRPVAGLERRALLGHPRRRPVDRPWAAAHRCPGRARPHRRELARGTRGRAGPERRHGAEVRRAARAGGHRTPGAGAGRPRLGSAASAGERRLRARPRAGRGALDLRRLVRAHLLRRGDPPTRAQSAPGPDRRGRRRRGALPGHQLGLPPDAGRGHARADAPGGRGRRHGPPRPGRGASGHAGHPALDVRLPRGERPVLRPHLPPDGRGRGLLPSARAHPPPPPHALRELARPGRAGGGDRALGNVRRALHHRGVRRRALSRGDRSGGLRAPQDAPRRRATVPGLGVPLDHRSLRGRLPRRRLGHARAGAVPVDARAGPHRRRSARLRGRGPAPGTPGDCAGQGWRAVLPLSQSTK